MISLRRLSAFVPCQHILPILREPLSFLTTMCFESTSSTTPPFLATTTTPIDGLTLDESKIEIGQTMAFVTLSFLELVHVFNVRDNKKSLFKTKIFNNRM